MSTPSEQIGTQDSVLIIDRSPESRDVLRTVLERRGLRILEADQASDGIHLARQFQPSVIVLNSDETATDCQSNQKQKADDLESRFRDYSQQHGGNLLILAAARRSGDPSVVAKPYHYGPLIRKIESLAAGVRAS